MSRWTYFAARLLLSIPVVVFGTSLTFVILYQGPISPAAAILGQSASGAEYREVEEQLGLHKPLWEQYVDFMIDMFTFNLPYSWVISPSTPAYDVIVTYAPRTIWLGFWAILLPLFVGIPMGFYAGLNSNSWGDYMASFGGIVWRAAPNFWLALLFLYGLSSSEELLWGFDWKSFIVETPQMVGAPPLDNLTDPDQFLKSFKRILPASLVLGSASMGNEMRIGRTALLETKNSNYVEMAKAKGVSGRAIVWKHMFRNALIPLIPVITAETGLLLGGSVLVELVFGINGIGKLFFDALMGGDVPLAGALMYIFILLLVFTNILQDFLYTVVDPRVGFESE